MGVFSKVKEALEKANEQVETIVREEIDEKRDAGKQGKN